MNRNSKLTTATFICCTVILFTLMLGTSSVFPSSRAEAIDKLDTVPHRWYYFIAGGNITLSPTFVFSSNNSFTMTVVDLWCEGDVYRVDALNLDTNETSSFVTSDATVPENITCNFIDTPEEAFNSSDHSFGNFSFDSGTYAFNIESEQEYDLYGALRFDLQGLNETELNETLSDIDPVDVCRAKQYFVLQDEVEGSADNAEAESACDEASPGASLAETNTTDLQDAASLLFSCHGAFSQSWIKSFNGDDFGDTCIALDSGAGIGAAVVVPSENCTAELVPLCQVFNETYSDDSVPTTFGEADLFAEDPFY